MTFAVNSLPNEKILALTKLKAFVDDKFSVAKVMISVFDRAKNIVGKVENAGYQHFLLLPHNVFKSSCFKIVKSRGCVVKRKDGVELQNKKTLFF